MYTPGVIDWLDLSQVDFYSETSTSVSVYSNLSLAYLIESSLVSVYSDLSLAYTIKTSVGAGLFLTYTIDSEIISVGSDLVVTYNINELVYVNIYNEFIWSIIVQMDHTSKWSDSVKVSATTGVTWSDNPIVNNTMTSDWSQLELFDITTSFDYMMLSNVEMNQSAVWDLTTSNAVSMTTTLTYALRPDVVVQNVTNVPFMTFDTESVRLTDADISCDVGSPVWIASVGIADVDVFTRIAIGDSVSIYILGEVYNFIVDGKNQARSGDTNYSIDCSLSLISPVALLGSPYSANVSVHSATSIMASVAVTSVLGPVDWQMPDWLIPAGQFAVPSSTPLEIARRVVAVIGGTLYSNPDGTVVCAMIDKVSPDQYQVTPTGLDLFDSDVFKSSSKLAPFNGFDRVQVDNDTDGSSSSTDDTSDSVEYEEYNDLSGTVRGYPSPWRSVALFHSGIDTTEIVPLDIVSRVETETVEFVGGDASVKYPVKSIVAMTWHTTDLGSVTFDGRNLTSSNAGFSLLEVSYVTESYEWFVSGEDGTKIQFVLGEIGQVAFA